MTPKFGELLKALRIAKGIGVRQACRLAYGKDNLCANWSRVENGISPPPMREWRIRNMVKNLNFSEDEIKRLLDAAYRDRIAMMNQRLSDYIERGRL